MQTRCRCKEPIIPWRTLSALLCAATLACWASDAPAADAPAGRGGTDPAPDLLRELGAYPHRILYETCRDGNFEIYISNADGSHAVNLTRTPGTDELYPKASPDGSRICFVADEGAGAEKARNLYVMNIDGTGRTRIADNAREPCWGADAKSIAFLRGEFRRFNLTDFGTRGIVVYDVETRDARPHPDDAIEHLYCLNWTPDRQWFVATVHGGLGFKHANLALRAQGAQGAQAVDLGLRGCRPDLSPDGTRIAWGHGDNAIGVADLDWTGPIPKASFAHNAVECAKPVGTYHADWSPDGRYIAFSRGEQPDVRHLGNAPAITGAKAPGWNICVVDATRPGRWIAITTDGVSCKEPDWVPAKP